MKDENVTRIESRTTDNSAEIITILKEQVNTLLTANKKLRQRCSSLQDSLKTAVNESDLFFTMQEKMLIEDHNFKFIAELMPQIVWTAFPNGMGDYINKQGLEFLGISQQNDIRMAFGNAIHPEDVLKAKFLWSDAIKSGQPFEVSYRLRRFDGEYHWFLVRGVPQKDPSGNVIKWYGTLTDINDQKLLEEKLLHTLENLKEAQMRYNNAERLAKLGSWMHNLETDEITFSNEFSKIYGLENKSGEFYYHQILNMVHPEDLDRLSESIRQSLEEKKTFDIQYRLIMPDSSIKTIHTISEPELNSDGRVTKRYGATMDITEQKDQEIKLNKTLEELERSNKELEHFAYVASHDLQEPLRIITNFTNLLNLRYKNKLDKKASDYLNFILESTARMRELITDLLTYAGISSGTRIFIPVNLNSIVAEVCSNLSISIADSGANIICDPLPVIDSNPVLMKQLFQNLIGNALKFRGDSIPEIHIYSRLSENFITFYVKDNGIGIDPVYQSKIFDLFQRLHNRDEYSGTGIGLAICKKIVEQHNGTIAVSSEPGKGSVFYFSLPSAKAELSA